MVVPSIVAKTVNGQGLHHVEVKGCAMLWSKLSMVVLLLGLLGRGYKGEGPQPAKQACLPQTLALGARSAPFTLV